MQVINKKIVIFICLSIFIFGSFKLFNKEKVELDDVKLDIINRQEGNSLAIMLQNDDGSYKESTDFPIDGYHYNKNKSQCTGINGNIIESVLSYDYETNKVVVDTTESVNCYLYFDSNLFTEDLSGNNNIPELHNIKTWTEEGIHTYNDGTTKGYVSAKFNKYFTDSSFTIITRVRVDENKSSCTNQNACYYILMSVGDPGRFVGISYHVSGNVENIIGTGGNVFSSNNSRWIYSQQKLSYQEWGTLISRYDGNIFSLYINGEKVIESKPVLEDSLERLNNAYIGAATNSNLVPFATFSDVLIFDTALSDKEVKENFSGEINKEQVLNKYVNNSTEQKLLLYYKFD